MGLDHQNGTNGVNNSPPTSLWRHSFPESTEMFRFMQLLNIMRGLQLKSYKDLYQWSIDNISVFWEEVWKYTGVKASASFHQVQLPPLNPTRPVLTK